MSDFPAEYENRCEVCRPAARVPSYPGVGWVWRSVVWAIALVALAGAAVNAFAAVNDQGYAFDSDCGRQGAVCPFSAPYHLRIGVGDQWSYLGVFGPASAVQCPYSTTAGAQCWYLAGTEPAGEAQGSAGPVQWSMEPYPADPGASAPATMSDNDSLNALSVGLLFVIGGVGFIGGRLR